MRIQTTTRFNRDARRAAKRGKNLDKLWDVVEMLESRRPLESRHRPHQLSGAWAHCWECHIEPDWILIWKATNDTLILVRTGTHADLFG
ncbi:MAG: type II toxin-antitoxin system YafQ family toxin [bacterium]|nr:type II toxin-antitoxin system YafQ family toxin [bacterium]MDE0602191.1 type II toxin-antitoxin system YafQ family toxin [bacterium]